MEFLYPYFLISLLFLPLLWIVGTKNGDDLRRRFTPELYNKMVAKGGGLGRRVRLGVLLVSAAFGIVALSRPVIERGEIKVERQTVDLVVAFDISRSMFADDVYPNRFELAKRKFFDLLEDLNDARVGVIGFSSRAFLVAPLTRDFASVKYLVEHMGLDFVSLRGTDMFTPLEVTENLLHQSDKKAVLIFTDGGDKKEFSKEIAYARAHGIKVFIYAIGTEKGGVMKSDGGIVRDSVGNIVITRLNPAVKVLAEETGGVYMRYSLSSGDMKQLAEAIRSRLKATKTKESLLKDREELFYYPLMVAIALFLAAYASLPKRDAKRAAGEMK
ncbi:vWA domain-containing protein [Hydrogenimonas cancrithermarum]|uniref:Membrane protein n=1 Tax=Hydrogenimonas cancrithermarum TaxID=2993563 RepID=A0ABM8FK93_9BACT|nr:VWA domain-containing protein [Hydrogenimonas cancrithermarum]BDY11712.1 membrane protein [Hydrogenimonas cancrithermarum]